MIHDFEETWGTAANCSALPEHLNDGISFLSDFWKEKYLKEYLAAGGSKIKFITGRSGSGKTHFLHLMKRLAEEENYVTAEFSARDIWLHDFREIYLEVLSQCDIMTLLQSCAKNVIRRMGYDPEAVPEELSFMDFLAQQDMGDALTKRELRQQLKKLFLEDPLMDNNFALAASLLTGGILGHPLLEQQNQELLLQWLHGDKTVKLSLLRSLGLSPSRITKYNARHMLRSLAEVVRLAGKTGLLITVDDMETLVSRSPLEKLHYTKLKREDTYESIRQLIDDIDSMKHIMFLFSFERTLLDNDTAGIKSYQALWMRIQNEIIGERFNRFTDIADLDRLAIQEYSVDVLVRMSEQLAASLAVTAADNEGKSVEKSTSFRAISAEEAEALRQQAKIGGIGLPELVKQAVEGGEADV